MTDIPAWLTIGAKVGVLSGRGVAETATVVRFTKTRVYLDRRREDWFPLKTLRVHVGGSWGDTSYVVPTDDPAFQRALTARRLRAAVFQVDTAARAVHDWQRITDDQRAEVHKRATRLAELTAPSGAS